jgi:hypothetical protein
LREEMAQHAVDMVEKYHSLTKEIDAYVKLYQRAL